MGVVLFSIRSETLGPPYGCRAACEGTGVIGLYRRFGDVRPDKEAPDRPRDVLVPPIYIALWFLIEARARSGDGWHFMPCPDCKPDDPTVQLAIGFLNATR